MYQCISGVSRVWQVGHVPRAPLEGTPINRFAFDIICYLIDIFSGLNFGFVR